MKQKLFTKKYFERHFKLKKLRRNDPIQFSVLYNDWVRKSF